jgi:hypothetical protein
VLVRNVPNELQFSWSQNKGGGLMILLEHTMILDDASLPLCPCAGNSRNKFLEQVGSWNRGEKRVEFLGFVIPLGVGASLPGPSRLYTPLGPSLVDQQFNFSLKQRQHSSFMLTLICHAIVEEKKQERVIFS